MYDVVRDYPEEGSLCPPSTRAILGMVLPVALWSEVMPTSTMASVQTEDVSAPRQRRNVNADRLPEIVLDQAQHLKGRAHFRRPFLESSYITRTALGVSLNLSLAPADLGRRGMTPTLSDAARHGVQRDEIVRLAEIALDVPKGAAVDGNVGTRGESRHLLATANASSPPMPEVPRLSILTLANVPDFAWCLDSADYSRSVQTDKRFQRSASSPRGAENASRRGRSPKACISRI